MSTVLTRWRARLAIRRALLAYAKRQLAYRQRKHSHYHHKSDLPDAKRRELATKWHKLVEEAEKKVAEREDQVAYAERVVSRHRYPTRMSSKGKELLTREEGVRRYAYNDPVGHATFGVGHLLHYGPVTEADRREWGTPSNPAPMSKVLDVLAADLKKYEAAVRRATGDKLTEQHQFDACVSLAFNIGVAGFESSTVARQIRNGKLQAAADAFLMWDNPSMLRPRRVRERRLLLTGRYS